ncbi:MAG: B12-binding domain-containing protein [Nitrososphaeria archaeon]
MSEEVLSRLRSTVLDYDVAGAERVAREAAEAGIDPLEAIERALTPAVREVGELFARGEVFLPELIMAGEAMKAGAAVLQPLVSKGKEIHHKGRVVIGTVAGDLHDIGKSIVVAMLIAEGFGVVDLGVDVPTKTFVEEARRLDADIVAMSALLTSALPEMKRVIQLLRGEELRRAAKVLVGGAATTRRYAESIGSDGWGGDAVEAVKEAVRLIAVDKACAPSRTNQPQERE